MGVVNDLLKVQEAEHGGETAFDRLDFQTAWGISRIIELHSAHTAQPYAIAFEFHDDIAEVDDPCNPAYLRMYQLKTKKSGGWTLAAISKPGKAVDGSAKQSFAGRMHANLSKFGCLAEKTVFVSNQPLSDAKGALGEISFDKIDKKPLGKFLDVIKVERATFSEQDDLPRFRFFECGLHLNTYDNTVVGQIAMFLAAKIGGEVDAKRFYLTLGFECRNKSKHLADLSSIDDLIASKFVTRERIDSDLKLIHAAKIRRPLWGDVSKKSLLPHYEEKKLRDAWHEYSLARISRNTPAIWALAQEIETISHPIINKNEDFWEGIKSAASLVLEKIETVHGPQSHHFAMAAVLYEYHK